MMTGFEKYYGVDVNGWIYLDEFGLDQDNRALRIVGMDLRGVGTRPAQTWTRRCGHRRWLR